MHIIAIHQDGHDNGPTTTISNSTDVSTSNGNGNDNNDNYIGVESSSLTPLFDEHLNFAKETLSRFDLILELSRNVSCDEMIYEMLGFNLHTNVNEEEEGEEEGGGQQNLHVNVMNKANYKQYYRRESYIDMNRLDLALYEYGQQLMEIDCQFFSRIYDIKKNKEKEEGKNANNIVVDDELIWKSPKNSQKVR